MKRFFSRRAAAAVATSLWAAAALAQPAAVGRTEVLDGDVAGALGKRAHMWTSELAPGAATGWHVIPTPRFVYVIEGSVTLEIQGEPPRTFKAGEAFQEAPTVLLDLRNASATARAKVLGFQIADKGQSLQAAPGARTPLGTMPTKPLPAAKLAPRQARPGDVDPLDAYRAQRSLEALEYYLVGTWDTVPQEEDQGVSVPMRLRIARIWPERKGEWWYYFEYSDPKDERNVTRQRIFLLTSDGVDIVASVYRLPGDAASYAGEWRKEKPFASLDPRRLVKMEGCDMLWQRQMEFIYSAGTVGNECRGDRPEVRDEHTDFYVTNTSIRTWIRGLDADGNQIEGLHGPSEFRKVPGKLR